MTGVSSSVRRGGQILSSFDNNAMVKVLARAFRWQRMLESGNYANLTERATVEKVTLPYLTSILRLAHLAPDLVEMILDGRQPIQLKLQDLISLPSDWNAQRARFSS